MEKKIVVLGGIGKTDRENRDNMRVLAGGTVYALKAHIDKEQPLVIKRYRKQGRLTTINGE